MIEADYLQSLLFFTKAIFTKAIFTKAIFTKATALQNVN
ncbi:MAG: hypothetical protein RI894_1492, partial [Bacteroidota bacterium]